MNGQVKPNKKHKTFEKFLKRIYLNHKIVYNMLHGDDMASTRSWISRMHVEDKDSSLKRSLK